MNSWPLRCALFALLALGACGPAAKTKSTVASKAPAKVKPLGDAQSGYHQVMRSKTIDGGVIASERKPTAMVVFASWCGPCRQELAALGEIRQKFPTLRVIGINAYEEYAQRSDQERLRTFLQANAPWMKTIVFGDSALLRDFGRVPNIPTLFVYDDKGGVVAEFRRNKREPPTHDELEAAIASAVAASAAPTP